MGTSGKKSPGFLSAVIYMKSCAFSLYFLTLNICNTIQNKLIYQRKKKSFTVFKLSLFYLLKVTTRLGIQNWNVLSSFVESIWRKKILTKLELIILCLDRKKKPEKFLLQHIKCSTQAYPKILPDLNIIWCRRKMFPKDA